MGSRSRSVSRSKSRSRSRTVSRSKSKSRSRTKSPPRKRRSRTRSRSRGRTSRDRRRRSPSPRSRRRSRSRGSRGSRSVSPLSNRKRHVGDREDPPAGRCLGVFGLSLYTTEREVRDTFERYGRVESCQIVYDHSTGRSRGFCFLTFEKMQDAEDAKERLNGQELDGRRIRVDFSITQRAHTPTPGKYFGRSDQRAERGGSREARGGSRGERGDSRRAGRSRSRSRSRSRDRFRDRY